MAQSAANLLILTGIILGIQGAIFAFYLWLKGYQRALKLAQASVTIMSIDIMLAFPDLSAYHHYVAKKRAYDNAEDIFSEMIAPLFK